MDFRPFLIRLKECMISKATSKELKLMLDEEMEEIKKPEDRMKLLNEVYKLWYSRDIDVYYKGGIPEFKSYMDYRIRKTNIVIQDNKPIEIQKDWADLVKSLIKSGYILDISLNDFEEVMNFRRLPNGKQKIKWLKSKSEAVLYQKYFNFTMKEFNECFIWKNGQPFFEKNRPKGNPKPQFLDILKKAK